MHRAATSHVTVKDYFVIEFTVLRLYEMYSSKKKKKTKQCAGKTFSTNLLLMVKFCLRRLSASQLKFECMTAALFRNWFRNTLLGDYVRRYSKIRQPEREIRLLSEGIWQKGKVVMFWWVKLKRWFGTNEWKSNTHSPFILNQTSLHSTNDMMLPVFSEFHDNILFK